MWSWIIAGIVALAFGTGASNYVSALIYRATGTWSTAYVDGTGEAVAMTLGPAAPVPDWMPRPRGTVVVTASRSLTGPLARQFATLDFATRMSKADLDRFYDEELAAAGFTITRRDADIVDPQTARMLGVDGELLAIHHDNGGHLKISIRTSNGWILTSRIVQLAWWDKPLVPPPAPPR
jgi:hypothetical protein